MLIDFFRINLPYGLHKNKKGEWIAFNREYRPLGWSKEDRHSVLNGEDGYLDLPVFTAYNKMTEKVLIELAPEFERRNVDGNGNIITIWLYGDATNPMNYPKEWKTYFEKIKILSQLETYASAASRGAVKL
jgi:hypothetical protein